MSGNETGPQWTGKGYAATPTPPPGPPDKRTLTIALILTGAAIFVAVVVVVAAVAYRAGHADNHERSGGGGGPATSAAITPSSSSPGHTATELTDWRQIGGIDAHPGSSAAAIVLDTHDTTTTWTTKWSGLIEPTGSVCTLHFSGRIRDITHSLGVPGGYGIGLATTQEDPSNRPTLYGSAVQYDFGQGGYRTAIYPDDNAFGLVPASLDHDWHDIEVVVDSAGFMTEVVDGKAVVHQSATRICGQPVIRVWAGAVEFADVFVSQ
jgi:hypothetical protein